jgi:glycerol-3-phosphate acyltransferase PlsY
MSLPVHSSDDWWTYLTCGAFFGFLIGSIPFGYLIGKWNGIDLREHGSGNIGATNVWRTLGWKWGLPCFVADFLKGVVPLLVLINILPHQGLHGEMIRVAVALFSILGHNFTPWLGFRGGKGIATSAGVLLMLVPLSFACVVVTWILLVLVTRYVSVGSIVAAAILPIATAYFYPGAWLLLGFCVLAAVLAILRHKSNIVRLLAGKEAKFGRKKGTS